MRGPARASALSLALGAIGVAPFFPGFMAGGAEVKVEATREAEESGSYPAELRIAGSTVLSNAANCAGVGSGLLGPGDAC